MGAILEKFLKWRVSLLLSALLTLCSISPLKAQAIGVEIDSLRSYLTFLAGERLQGRFPGTPHDSIAAHYIAEKMAQSGLVPLFGNSYLLPFNFIIERKILESSLKFDSITLKKGRDYSFSPLSPTTSFKGELLSVAEVVKGRNPLLLLNIAHDSLKYIVTKEMERGYRAILNLDPSGKVIVEEGIKGSPFPIPVISISSSLYSQFLNSPNGEVEVEVKTAPIEITTYNVAGRRVPTEGELSILVGAHYDHLGVKESAHSTTVEREIFYGADDNASGVAALLELIRVSQQKSRNQPSLSTGWNPIFVAFGAEEQGVIGSTHLADTLDALGALPKIMLNLDMVGRLRKEA
ncbi:MAG: M28 family peptidase, partial [Bacteroidales bacterium]